MLGEVSLGEIVISTQGRDTGKFYIVVSIENEQYVKIVDGDKKRLKNPKLKNIKHLRTTGHVEKELSIWLSSDKRIRDEDLKKVIKDYENKEAN